uniref:Uncharacterized protein n=1 Tax=Arundo donax TaxID=35708 RepID=A0A0A9E916_ARUDO
MVGASQTPEAKPQPFSSPPLDVIQPVCLLKHASSHSSRMIKRPCLHA